MHNGGFSHRRVADHFRVNHSIIVRLMQRFRQTGNVTEITKTANQFEISSLLEKILLKQVRWCLTFIGLYISDLNVPLCSVFVKRGMLLTVHVQVDLAKRRRGRTGSYPNGRGNGRSEQLVHFVVN
jgi:hypothetical protein